MNKEFLEKAKVCKSVEDLLSLAKEDGIDLTEAEAKNCFAQLNPTNGELSDNELEMVAGGCGGDECSAGGDHDWCPTGKENLESTELRCSKCGDTKWSHKNVAGGLR